MKTFEIRVTNSKDKIYLKDYIFKYRHWQNILTILVINLFKANNSDYKHFLDYAVVRACIADTKGDKKKIKTIADIKEKYKDNGLYQDLVSVGQELKTHNLVEIVKRLKKDFSNYFKALKDYKKNLDKYTGLPQLPKAKKLSQLTNYSIPLDSSNSISFKRKNVVGINLNSKMRYFYIGKRDEIEIFRNNEIKSVKVKFQNNQIYLQFTYKPIHSQFSLFNFQLTKYAGLDIGLNNIISLFIDDNSTPSLIVDGAKYKYYNYRYNKQVAKLNKTISEEVIEFKESKRGTQYPIKWSSRGNYLKRFKTYLTQKRNEYFKNSFHKLSKKVVEYLQLHNVTHLVISSSLAELKNSGNCTLKKSVKQNFIQIPFIQLLNYIEEKCKDAKIEVIRVDESYTSKTSCISADVCDVQEYSNEKKSQEESTCTTKPSYNGKRTKRGLFKDTIINKIFNADLNGAVNHIKLAKAKSFKWLKENLWKICNPIKIKSAGELHSLLCNIRSNKSYERRTTARAYRYAIS